VHRPDEIEIAELAESVPFRRDVADAIVAHEHDVTFEKQSET